MPVNFARSGVAMTLVTLAAALWCERADAQPSALKLSPLTIAGGSDDSRHRSWSLVGTVESSPEMQNTSPAPERRDSLLNGVLIGAGIGALLGLIPDHFDDCEECHDSLYGSIAVGAGIGLIVDLLRSDKRPSPSRANERFRMSIAGSRQAVGVHGAVHW